ncbi:MAG: NADH:ubiquinone reductase (Na(+)-transporting) subunit A [Bacteroidetes bacterium HGW-Bacteroidetes-16]|jgi:Na+-transporting NADH:ubiquinone oxidoreductase subunit A|nr:MAG: NADH:ubiquinone reductase (Na(+)-transporting) subunit A [Bacteroidetes bacterium HGW-Bacteroidetes-16]
MSTNYLINKGLDIKLLGGSEKTIVDYSAKRFAIKPTDFIGVFPKMMVAEGDVVQAGTPLFYDKSRTNIIFTSPVSGKVEALKRGAKRRLLEIIIESDDKFDAVQFGPRKVNGMNREAIIETMLQSGIWPMLRQRPYSVIANPAETPKAIFIPAFDTSPLAPDFDLVVHGKGQEFQTGLDVLKKLTNGPVHLNVDAKNTTSKVFLNSKNVQINKFSGPHPTGNVSVQASKISPINKGEVIWYLYPQDVITIGSFFLNGKVDFTRIIALAGSEVLKPRYYKTLLGACIKHMVEGNLTKGNNRTISGNVLTGEKIEIDGFVGFYDSMVTVIPEGNEAEFFGWLLPGFNKFSFSKTFLSWMFTNRKYRLNTNLHGGHRSLVMTGKYEQVFPFDIYPMALLKAIMVEDIDGMENLGIYEIDAEDFALCEVIDTSKTEMQAIVRKGLELMRQEMS